VSELNDAEKRILSVVAEHGWMVMSVAPRAGCDDPKEWWSYTIGLTKTFGWPEIITFGLAGRDAHPVLNDSVAELWQKGLRPAPGVVLNEVLEGFQAKLVTPFPMATHYFGSAIWFSRHNGLPVPPPVVQLIWPDNDGVFPDDARCAEGVRLDQTPLEKA
jgi:hypothetical protein